MIYIIFTDGKYLLENTPLGLNAIPTESIFIYFQVIRACVLFFSNCTCILLEIVENYYEFFNAYIMPLLYLITRKVTLFFFVSEKYIFYFFIFTLHLV